MFSSHCEYVLFSLLCVYAKTEDGRHLKQHANKNYAEKHLLVEMFLCLLVLPSSYCAVFCSTEDMSMLMMAGVGMNDSDTMANKEQK